MKFADVVVRLLRCFVLAIVSAVGLSGCESHVPVLTSNKDSNYTLRLTRVLVATKLANKSLLEGTSMAPAAFQKAISDDWAAYGVTVSGVDLEGGDSKVLAAAVASNRPRQVLEITTVNVTKKGSSIIDANFDCSIYDIAAKKRVWRATLHTSGPLFFVRQTAPSEVVGTLTEKLKADGLL